MPDEALRRGLVLLTTDAEVLERRIVVAARSGTGFKATERRGESEGVRRSTAPAWDVLWLPSALTTAEKLGLVLRDRHLPLRAPRCMSCGGELIARSKDAVRERIPPRTARWKDEYFVCAVCDRLFWQGTHWQRIASALRAAAAG